LDCQAGNSYSNNTFIKIGQCVYELTPIAKDGGGTAAVVRKLNDLQFGAKISGQEY
jgi:hypothetical protein